MKCEHKVEGKRCGHEYHTFRCDGCKKATCTWHGLATQGYCLDCYRLLCKLRHKNENARLRAALKRRKHK